jgi:hypothetical protein
MNPFSQVTEAELVRARNDPAFRQRLLRQSLDALLAKLQKERQASPTAAGDTLMREGVALAVQVAELIQAAGGPERGP